MRHTCKPWDERKPGEWAAGSGRGPLGAALPVAGFRRAGSGREQTPLLPHLLDALRQELEVGGAMAADDAAGADCQLGERIA